MCSSPKIVGGNRVSCRVCDACLQTRINDWVARAAAEAAASPHTLALTLTYADHPDGTRPIGSRAFHYNDVQRFLKSLRTEIWEKSRSTGDVRYIVCGEKGSNGSRRIHYHTLLFSTLDPFLYGTIRDLKGLTVTPNNVENEKTYHWSLWPHGNVHVQKPGQHGIYYALKYAMKDHQSVARSRGHRRETTAPVHTASKFMMSKKPPIGMRFIHHVLDQCRKRGNVVPSINLSVPNYTGYLHPKGVLRNVLLEGLREINETHRQRYGKNTASYSSLLESLKRPGDSAGQINPDLDEMLHGKTLSKEEQNQSARDNSAADFDAFKAALAVKQSVYFGAKRKKQIYARCSGSTPCVACWNALSKRDRKTCYWQFRLGLNAYAAAHPLQPVPAGVEFWSSRKDHPEIVLAYREAGRDHGVPSQWCQLADLPEVREACTQVAAATRLAAGGSGPLTDDNGRSQGAAGRPAPYRPK